MLGVHSAVQWCAFLRKMMKHGILRWWTYSQINYLKALLMQAWNQYWSRFANLFNLHNGVITFVMSIYGTGSNIGASFEGAELDIASNARPDHWLSHFTWWSLPVLLQLATWWCQAIQHWRSCQSSPNRPTVDWWANPQRRRCLGRGKWWWSLAINCAWYPSKCFLLQLTQYVLCWFPLLL